MIIGESYFEDDGKEKNSLQKNVVEKQRCVYIPKKCEPEVTKLNTKISEFLILT